MILFQSFEMGAVTLASCVYIHIKSPIEIHQGEKICFNIQIFYFIFLLFTAALYYYTQAYV
jgi:hypothetical protein